MNQLLQYILEPASYQTAQIALCFIRISLGIMTMFHGLPKITGGIPTWQHLGTFVNPLGIYSGRVSRILCKWLKLVS